MRTGVERLVSARIRSEVAFCQSTVAEVSGTLDKRDLASRKADSIRDDQNDVVRSSALP